MARFGKNAAERRDVVVTLAVLFAFFFVPLLVPLNWNRPLIVICILVIAVFWLLALAVRPVLRKSSVTVEPWDGPRTPRAGRALRWDDAVPLGSGAAAPEESRPSSGAWELPAPIPPRSEPELLPEPVDAPVLERYHTPPAAPALRSGRISFFTPDLIEKLRAIDWFQFEKVVAWMYRRQGYEVARKGGGNPDGGIDLIVEKDGERTGVQCKQWKSWKVREEAVRGMVGALYRAGIHKGVIVILGECGDPALQMAEEQGIDIMDETGLAMMLAATGAQCDPEVLALLNDERKFCPKCESEMVLRSARLDPRKKFWGCSTFPRCKFKMKLA